MINKTDNSLFKLLNIIFQVKINSSEKVLTKLNQNTNQKYTFKNIILPYIKYQQLCLNNC